MREEKLHRDGKGNDQEDELRRLQNAGLLGHPQPVPFLIDEVAAHDQDREGDGDAEPPPRLATARVAGKRLERTSRPGVGEGELGLPRGGSQRRAGLSAIWPSEPRLSDKVRDTFATAPRVWPAKFNSNLGDCS